MRNQQAKHKGKVGNTQRTANDLETGSRRNILAELRVGGNLLSGTAGETHQESSHKHMQLSYNFGFHPLQALD